MSSTTIATTEFGSALISASGSYDVSLAALSTLSVDGNLDVTFSSFIASSLYTLDTGNNDNIVFQTITDGLGAINFGGGNIDFLSGSVDQNTNITFSGIGNVTFSPMIGAGTIDPSHIVGPAFTDFSIGDTIDLSNIPFETNGSEILSYSSTNNDLLIENTKTGQFFNINFDSPVLPSGEILALKTDATGGTEIFISPPCFAAGTHILTAGGEIQVERIQKGTPIVLADGRIVPVTWLGHRTIDITRHPHPETVRPVLIRAGAIGDVVPARDLYLSPDHAIHLDGHLIPAKTLINGSTIRQVDHRTVTYYHVELPEHAVLWAEGTPCESYLETGNRHSFENGGAPAIALHPAFGPTTPDWQRVRETRSCAPLIEEGSVVEAVRARLLLRADIATTPDADLAITRRADGSITITSRSAIPGYLSPDPRDRRRLGVKIASILRKDGTFIPLDHPELTQGWHDPEPDGRWTNGRALIPANLVSDGLPDITLVATLAYPAEKKAGSQRRFGS